MRIPIIGTVALLLGIATGSCEEILGECFEPLGMKEFTAEPIAQNTEGLFVMIHWNTSFENDNEGACNLYRRGSDDLEVSLVSDGGFDGYAIDKIHESVVYRIDCSQICGEDLEREIQFDYSPFE